MAPPEQSEYGRFQYDDKRRDEAKLDAGQSLGDPAVNRLIRELTKALQEVLSEEGHDFLVEQDELDALNAQIPPNPYGEEEPPPPDPDTNNPNPEDPRGPRPSGPWERGRSQQGRNNPAAQIGRYNPAGLSSVPNDFDPRGPGPVGPWSSGPSRGAYYATGRYAVPNDFDPRGPRPAGPLSRGLSRPTYGSYRGDGDVMPNPEADPGHGGSVGPAS